MWRTVLSYSDREFRHRAGRACQQCPTRVTWSDDMPSLKEALVELARADRRTLASYIELVLEVHVDAKRQEGKKPKTRR